MHGRQVDDHIYIALILAAAAAVVSTAHNHSGYPAIRTVYTSVMSFEIAALAGAGNGTPDVVAPP